MTWQLRWPFSCRLRTEKCRKCWLPNGALITTLLSQGDLITQMLMTTSTSLFPHELVGCQPRLTRICNARLATLLMWFRGQRRYRSCQSNRRWSRRPIQPCAPARQLPLSCKQSLPSDTGPDLAVWHPLFSAGIGPACAASIRNHSRICRVTLTPGSMRAAPGVPPLFMCQAGNSESELCGVWGRCSGMPQSMSVAAHIAGFRHFHSHQVSSTPNIGTA